MSSRSSSSKEGSVQNALVLAGKLVAGSALVYALYRFYKCRCNKSRTFKLESETRTLFQRWEQRVNGASATITDAEIERRFWDVYDTALASHSYRCIHEKKFMEPRVTQHPFYYSLLHQPIPATLPTHSQVTPFTLSSHLESKSVSSLRLLDIGCCFGTDLRRVILDGFEVSNVFGLDINTTFIDLGLDNLFLDRKQSGLENRLKKFDILSQEPATCPEFQTFLSGGIDVIYIGSVYHLLNEAQTLRLSTVAFQFVRAGGVVFGRTVGCDDLEGDYVRKQSAPSSSSSSSSEKVVRSPDLRFLHTVASLRAQMESVGFTNVRIEKTLIDMGSRNGHRMRFTTVDSNAASERKTCMFAFTAFKPQK